MFYKLRPEKGSGKINVNKIREINGGNVSENKNSTVFLEKTQS